MTSSIACPMAASSIGRGSVEACGERLTGCVRETFPTRGADVGVEMCALREASTAERAAIEAATQGCTKQRDVTGKTRRVAAQAMEVDTKKLFGRRLVSIERS